MTDHKEFYLEKMKRIRKEIRESLATRAAQNLQKYYSLLRSTGAEGIEDLIKAIDESTFKTEGSHNHHRYIAGTLEHSLGVYKRMSRKASVWRKLGFKYKESDIILVALLHDISNGSHPDWKGSGHGGRSRKIVEKYLPNVSQDVLEAIEGHMHASISGLTNPLWRLIITSDMPDSGTCDIGYAKISDNETVSLKS